MAQSAEINDEFILNPLLKIDNKGWNVSLFVDTNKITDYFCQECGQVCCNAVELGCDHDDVEDIYSYCKTCLEELIIKDNNKCIINGHSDPIINASRAFRRNILKSKILCPYSIKYKQKDKNNDAQNVIDTFGKFMDEKEGIVDNIIQEGCNFIGCLSDLINSNHLQQCCQKYDATFAQKIINNNLKNENKKLNNIIDEYKVKINNLNDIISKQNMQINEMKKKYKNNSNKKEEIKENEPEHENKLILFDLFDNTKFYTAKNKKVIKGMKSSFFSADGYMIYGDCLKFNDNTMITKWSVKALNTSYAYQHSIGITTERNKNIILKKSSNWYKGGKYSFYHGEGIINGWKSGEIITVFLDCLQWTVKYYKTDKKNRTTMIKEEKIEEGEYYFALCIQPEKSESDFEVVETPNDLR